MCSYSYSSLCFDIIKNGQRCFYKYERLFSKVVLRLTMSKHDLNCRCLVFSVAECNKTHLLFLAALFRPSAPQRMKSLTVDGELSTPHVSIIYVVSPSKPSGHYKSVHSFSNTRKVNIWCLALLKFITGNCIFC